MVFWQDEVARTNLATHGLQFHARMSVRKDFCINDQPATACEIVGGQRLCPIDRAQKVSHAIPFVAHGNS